MIHGTEPDRRPSQWQ